MRSLVLVALLFFVAYVASVKHTKKERSLGHRTQGLIGDLVNTVTKIVPHLNMRMPRNVDLTKINALNCARFSAVEGLIAKLKNRKATWEAGHNDFSCWNHTDLPFMSGAIISEPPKTAGNQEAKGGEVHALTADELDSIPTSFDSNTHWPGCLSAIRNQGQCGSCWAFSSTSAIQDRLCIRSSGAIKNLVLSPQQMVSCANNNGCGGGYLNTAWTFAQSNGLATDACYPYNTGTLNSGTVPACTTGCANTYKMNAPSYSYGGYLVAPYLQNYPSGYQSNIPLIQKEIMTNGPVQAAFSCTNEFYNYRSGVYKCVDCTSIGGHAIKITGWGVAADGTQYWICANSWGTSWGQSGYFWFAMGQLGIEASVYGGLPIVPSTSTVTTTTTTTTAAPAPAPPAATTVQQQTINSIFSQLQSYFSSQGKTLQWNANAATLCQSQVNFFINGKEAFGSGGWTAADANWATPRWTSLVKLGATNGYEMNGYRYDALPTTFASNVYSYLVSNIPNLATTYTSVGIGLGTVSGSSQTYYTIEFVK